MCILAAARPRGSVGRAEASNHGVGIPARAARVKGTTIKLYLPNYKGKIWEGEVATRSKESQKSLKGEVVLVINDEPVVRGLIVEVLEELG